MTNEFLRDADIRTLTGEDFKRKAAQLQTAYAASRSRQMREVQATSKAKWGTGHVK